MKRIAPLSIGLVWVCLVVLAVPAPAAADDADVTAAVTRWSLRIAKPAKQLQTKLTASSTPQQALGFLRSFTRTATNGRNAIAATTSSSAAGAKVRTLARNAFAQYAAAGRLLIQAVNDVVAGKGQRVVEPKVKRAIALATAGSKKLTQSANLIPQLVDG
jgi:hypothetical protein